MKKIFFVAYGGGHINIIDLIAEKIINDCDIEFHILALTTAYNKVIDKYSKGRVKKVSDYKSLFKNDIKQIEKYGFDLLKENYNPNSGISEDETVYYLGFSMYDLINRYGVEKARSLYNKKKRQAFLPISIMEKILTYEEADIVVATTSPRFEQAGLIAGNRMGIKTVEILDLFGELYPLPEAKHIVCMNSEIEKSLRNQGLNDRKYYLFGQPVIEKTANYILSINRERIAKKILLNKNKTLLFATQQPVIFNSDFSYAGHIGYEEINKCIFQLLYNLYVKYNVNILLRIHPNEDMDNYKQCLNKYPFVKYVNTTLSLEESLAISDIVVAQTSTVCLEAIASKKTVFTFKTDFDKAYTMPSYTKEPFIFSDGFIKLEENISNYLEGNVKISNNYNFLPKNSVSKIIKLLKEV